MPQGGERVDSSSGGAYTEAMIAILVSLLAASPACAEVRQQCRACPRGAAIARCSTPGIACQPVVRVCTPVQARGAPSVRKRPRSA